MMHGIALLFEDEATAKLITQTIISHTIKRLGRLVNGFEQKKWNKNREDTVYINSIAKLTKNENL